MRSTIFKENDRVRSALSSFLAWKKGLELPHPQYPKLDLFHQYFCADQHDRAVHAPDDKRTMAAYKPFIAETIDQFEFLCRAGYRFEIWPYSVPEQPYQYSWQMREDVYRNQHLWVFKTGDMLDRHPMLEKSVRQGWVHNDVFRAVHDVAAHAWGGFGFAARGEDAAYQAHANIYSTEALPALAAETRLQSAWVLFGKHLRREGGEVPRPSESDYILLRQRDFPDQKAFAAPALCCKFTRYSVSVPNDVVRRHGMRLAGCA